VDGEDRNGRESGELRQRFDGRGENFAGISRREEQVVGFARLEDHVDDGGDDPQSFRVRLELGA
jgi:hypothetical protein